MGTQVPFFEFRGLGHKWAGTGIFCRYMDLPAQSYRPTITYTHIYTTLTTYLDKVFLLGEMGHGCIRELNRERLAKYETRLSPKSSKSTSFSPTGPSPTSKYNAWLQSC
jgi:hypothetical protein